MNDDKLVISGIEFRSRLWVGTGKYKDFDATKRAIEASGTDVVTVAVRRVNIIDKSKENLLDFMTLETLPPERMRFAKPAQEARGWPAAVRLAEGADALVLGPAALAAGRAPPDGFREASRFATHAVYLRAAELRT